MTLRAVTVTLGATVLLGSLWFLYKSAWKRNSDIIGENRRKPRLVSNDPFQKIVEICVSDYESAKNAVEGGATSIELCSNRMEGGTTPSIGLVEQCVDLVKGSDVLLQVLIRPRPGDFNYSNEEFEVIQRDIIAAKVAGADGVVCGILTGEGKVDLGRMAVVRHLSEGMILTFHRAFDIAPSMEEALDSIIMCNCDRLLTSGRCSSVIGAVENGQLEAIVKHTQGFVHVIAGAGITVDNVEKVIKKSFVTAVHAGSAVTAPHSSYGFSSYTDNVSLLSGSSCIAPEMMSYMCADKDSVRKLVQNAEQAWDALHISAR